MNQNCFDLPPPPALLRHTALYSLPSTVEDFYKDMAKYSFNLQIFLLNKRFKQQQQIVWAGTGGVQDRTIYEDAVFARMLRDSGLMTGRDFNCCTFLREKRDMYEVAAPHHITQFSATL